MWRHLFLLVLCCVASVGSSWLHSYCSLAAPSVLRAAFRLHATISVDISPDKDGSLLKEVLRKGDQSKPMAGVRDTVDIAWKIRDKKGTLLHDSRAPAESSVQAQEQVLGDSKESNDDEAFSFQLGAEPRHVIMGWEYAVRTMYEGEKTRVVVAPQWGFGSEGAPPLIPPNTTLDCELELLRIRPALTKRFRSIAEGESIEAELSEKIDSRQTPIAEAVLHRESTLPHSRVEQTPNPDIEEDDAGAVEAAAQRRSATGPQVKADGTAVRYFDPAKHKLDPHLRIHGTGPGGSYEWWEDRDALELEVPIKGGTEQGQGDAGLATKEDVEVVVRPDFLRVGLRGRAPLLEGPLHGRVDASAPSWALVDCDDLQQFRWGGARQALQVTLEKLHSSRDFWATVLKEEFLQQQLAIGKQPTDKQSEGEHSQ